MKSIYVVTHGKKEKGANPAMTSEGMQEVSVLRSRIPVNPSIVVRGAGRRHQNVAEALNLAPVRITGAFGSGDSLEMVDGEKMIVLTDGSYIESSQYTTLADIAPATEATAISLPDNAVVCAGRPSMIMLGVEDAKSAAVYCVKVEDNRIVDIEEVIATGVAEKGTV